MPGIFAKDGEFSKTAALLVASFVVVLAKVLLGGMTIVGVVVSEISPMLATGVLGAATTLYFGTHNLTKWKQNGNGKRADAAPPDN